MQTPLITNFSRGVISPKFAGRVDTEVYHQGAEVIEDFIVNNQGSLQRRPGTYRLWSTGFTYPSPAQAETDRFEVEVTAGEKFSLILLTDDGGQAQFILSKGGANPQHRFFEVAMAPGDEGVDLFRLTEFSPDGENYYTEAHSFITGDERVIDDSFVSNISHFSFMRLRNPAGYTNFSPRVWHSIISRDLCRADAAQIPFVKVGPLDPPEYRRTTSTLTHDVGFRVYDQDNALISAPVVRSRTVAQFTGQIVKGQYEESRDISRLRNGAVFNVSDESLIEDYGYLVLSVPNVMDTSVYPFFWGGAFTFYNHWPGKSKVKVNGVDISNKVAVNETNETVKIPFSVLAETSTAWTETMEVEIQYHGYVIVASGTPPGSLPSFRKVYKNLPAMVSVPSDWLDPYNNRVYDLETPVTLIGSDNYNLYYVEGTAASLLPPSTWEVAQASETHIEKVRIFSEADIHTFESKQLPSASAYYRIERQITGESQEVISRRIKPWVRTESATDFALEFVAPPETWLSSSLEKIQQGQSVVVHGGRMLILNDERDLSFLVSSLRDYANFYESDSEVDAYTFNIETERSERIQWVVSMREGLVVGTDKNEYVVLGVESPSNVQSRRYTGIGSSRPYAIRFGDKILFVGRDGQRIVAYAYSDELSAWYSTDLTSIAEHLFVGGIQSMHYMNEPISTIWVVPEGDNGLYALTWEPATGVQGWSHHMAGQNVLSAAVATIESRTALFVAVERQGKVVIEVLDFHEEGIAGISNYLDSVEILVWVKYVEGEDSLLMSPAGVDVEENYTINFGTGQWARFQGKELVVVVNGVATHTMLGESVPHSNSTLSIGPFEGADIPIELEDNTSVIVGVGMPFVSKLKTLPMIVDSRSGPGIIKNTQVHRARVRIDSSGDFKAGSTFGDMSRIELAEDGNIVQDGNVYTGDCLIPLMSRWTRRPALCIESYYAEPLNVLAIMADSQVFE